MGIEDPYFVWIRGQHPSLRGFGDELDEAIAYASDAASRGIDAEVWPTGTSQSPDRLERVWPVAAAV